MRASFFKYKGNWTAKIEDRSGPLNPGDRIQCYRASGVAREIVLGNMLWIGTATDGRPGAIFEIGAKGAQAAPTPPPAPAPVIAPAPAPAPLPIIAAANLAPGAHVRAARAAPRLDSAIELDFDREIAIVKFSISEGGVSRKRTVLSDQLETDDSRETVAEVKENVANDTDHKAAKELVSRLSGCRNKFVESSAVGNIASFEQVAMLRAALAEIEIDVDAHNATGTPHQITVTMFAHPISLARTAGAAKMLCAEVTDKLGEVRALCSAGDTSGMLDWLRVAVKLPGLMPSMIGDAVTGAIEYVSAYRGALMGERKDRKARGESVDAPTLIPFDPTAIDCAMGLCVYVPPAVQNFATGN